MEIDDEYSIDEDNFELRILNDDENEITVTKFDSKFDRSAVEDECSPQELDLYSSEQVANHSYSSADLEIAAISDIANNNGDGKVKRMATASATLRMSSAIDDRTSRSRDAIYDCVWCTKQFPTKRSLKYHVLSHLRALKQDSKDCYLASASEVDPAALDDTNANASFDFTCVFCEKLFSNKKTVIIHYITDHHQSDSQLQNRSKRTALNGPYWQSCETKIPDATTITSTISSSTEVSSTLLNNDENCLNEDASKQYKCYICDKQFARKSSLMWHIQFHETHKYPKFEKKTNESNLSSSVVDVNSTTDYISSTCTNDGYTCNICNCHFTHRSNYCQHMNSVHQMSSEEGSSLPQQTSGPKCESCGKFFSTWGNVRKHVRQNCKGPPSTMAESEDDEDASEDHPEEFSCNICGRSFFSQHAVAIHRSSKHRDEFCDTAVSDTRIDALIPCDSYTENDEGNFQCAVCDKIFETRKGVIRHIGYHRSAVNESMNESDRIDEEEENIPCPQCGKTFGSIRGMRIHANIHVEKTESDDESDENIGDEENKSGFECTICNKAFEGFRSYKNHIGWHSRREETVVFPKKKIDRSESINKTQKKTDRNEALTYPKNKSDKCETIVTPQKKPDKSTPSASAKIYQCQFCPRWYSTQQAFAGHMKAHQSSKPGTFRGPDQPHLQATEQNMNNLNTCLICGLHFSSGFNFSEHMQSHTTAVIPATSSGQLLTLEDTMECDICRKSFMHKQDMAKHMRDHINGTITKENVDLNLFRCIHCQKSFVGRKSLNTHQRLHEEAQISLKRPANEVLTDASPSKRGRQDEPVADVPDNSVGWDNMIQGHRCKQCERILLTKQSLERHMEWHERMNKTRGLSTLPTYEGNLPTVVSSTQEEDYIVPERMQNVEPETMVVNDLETLGEHAVVQCVEGGNEEYFVFEQREGEAFQCSECDETHFDKLQMIVHMSYHVGKRWANGRQRSLIIKIDPVMLAPFECMSCDERFVNKVFRNQHMVKRHGDDVMQCNTCRKPFLSKKRLAAHCQQHFPDPRYRCERCLKCFTSKWFLKRHSRKKCSGKSSSDIKEVKY